MDIFLVGGAVRDELLAYPFTERDWVVVGATPEELAAQGFQAVGKDFPVFLHPKTHEEYALARTEKKTAPGYKGFTFHTDTSVTLEDDLVRRDLTINAIAKDHHGRIIDPYDGQQDIKQRVLRHVSPAFCEDPVRILRVARFLARFGHLGFTIATNTLELMHTMVDAGETQHLVAERVWQECLKALGEKNPECFFQTLAKINSLEDILGISKHAHWEQSIKALSDSAKQTSDTSIRLGIFCYFIQDSELERLREKLTLPKQHSEMIDLLKQHYKRCSQNTWSASELAQLFKQCDAIRKPERFASLLSACHLLSLSIDTENNAQIESLLDALTCFRQVDPQTLIQQGYEKAALGQALEAAREHALEQWLSKQQG